MARTNSSTAVGKQWDKTLSITQRRLQTSWEKDDGISFYLDIEGAKDPTAPIQSLYIL